MTANRHLAIVTRACSASRDLSFVVHDRLKGFIVAFIVCFERMQNRQWIEGLPGRKG